MRHKQLQIAIETTTKEHHVLFCDIVLIMVGAEGLAFCFEVLAVPYQSQPSGCWTI